MATPLATGAETGRPNILLIMTDQQRADYLGCYGHPVIRTPHIDSLAEAGTAFDRFYVASPVCMPNRASIMTGRLPSLHGTRMNGIPLSLREVTFPEVLRRSGYRTALIGKSHLQNMFDLPPFEAPRRSAAPWAVPAGLEEARLRSEEEDYRQELPERWRGSGPYVVRTPFYGFQQAVLCTGHGDKVGGHYVKWLRGQGIDPDRICGPANSLPHDYACPQAWRTAVPAELYPTRFIQQEALRVLQRWTGEDSGSPFLLAVSFPDPHHPFTPPGRYWDLYRPADMPLPRSFDLPTTLPQVLHARAERARSEEAAHGYGAFAATRREAQEAAALTAGMVAMIDDAVGALLQSLRDSGRDRDTIVIFTSDHGDFLGDHGLLLKGPLHLQSLLRVPFIWRDPGRQDAIRRSAALASSIDIAATILDRVGIAAPNGMQGQSLLAAMGPPGAGGGAGSLLIEEDAQQAALGFATAPRIRTLVTDRYRLSLYGRSGSAELFDLREDPDEIVNRWSDPGFASVRRQLVEELALRQMESADTSPAPRYMA